MTQNTIDFIIYQPKSAEDYAATLSALIEGGMTPFALTGYKDQPQNPVYVTYSPTKSRGLPVFTDGTNDNDQDLIDRCQLISDRAEFVNLVTEQAKEKIKGQPLEALLSMLIRS